jgi:hypothetical protein
MFIDPGIGFVFHACEDGLPDLVCPLDGGDDAIGKTGMVFDVTPDRAVLPNKRFERVGPDVPVPTTVTDARNLKFPTHGWLACRKISLEVMLDYTHGTGAFQFRKEVHLQLVGAGTAGTDAQLKAPVLPEIHDLPDALTRETDVRNQ